MFRGGGGTMRRYGRNKYVASLEPCLWRNTHRIAPGLRMQSLPNLFHWELFRGERHLGLQGSGMRIWFQCPDRNKLPEASTTNAHP